MGQDVYREDPWKGHKQKDSDSQYWGVVLRWGAVKILSFQHYLK